MKVSDTTIKVLTELIKGNLEGPSPYNNYNELLVFFAELGIKCDESIKNRGELVKDALTKCNGTDKLEQIIIKIPNQKKSFKKINRIEVENKIKNILSIDKYEYTTQGIKRLTGNHNYIIEIDKDLLKPAKNFNQEFIQDQVIEARKRIDEENYYAAITTSRTLLEAAFNHIEKEITGENQSYKGDLDKQFKAIRELLNLKETDNLDDSLAKVIRGFSSIISGLAELSNKAGDRHAPKYKPSRHHALLAVNSAMTVTNFIFDTYNYQLEKGNITKCQNISEVCYE